MIQRVPAVCTTRGRSAAGGFTPAHPRSPPEWDRFGGGGSGPTVPVGVFTAAWVLRGA